MPRIDINARSYVTQKRVADLGAAALTSVYGTRYTTGSAANVLCKKLGASLRRESRD